MFEWPIERLVFVKRYVSSKLPLVGTSIEVYEAGDKVLAAIKDTDAHCLAANAALSEVQSKTLDDLIRAQAAISVDTVQIGTEIVATLAKIKTLCTFIESAVLALTARLTAARAPVPDAFLAEQDMLDKLAAIGDIGIVGIVSSGTQRNATADVLQVEDMRAGILSEIARRADALDEVGAAVLEKAAAKFGPARLTEMVANAHPPIADLLDESKISLEDLGIVLDGALGGNVAVLSGLLENGCGRDPAKLKDIAEAFPNGSEEQGHLSALVASGGFEEHPDAFASIFGIGCGGNPEKLKDFAAAMKDAPAQKTLSDLMDRGGLGEASDALGHVVAAGDAALILALGAEFSSGDDLEKLEDMVTKGGLGGATARSSDALAVMLKDGVDTPADLKKLHGNFDPNAMDDMRAMIAALDLRPPDTCNPGKQFAHVAEKVGAPPADMKADFFDVLDQSAKGSAARDLQKQVQNNSDVDAMLLATGTATDAQTTPCRNATIGGAFALAALDTVPGIATLTKQLLTDAVAGSGKAAVSAQAVSGILADVSADKTAEDALRAGLPDPGDDTAYAQAALAAKTASDLSKVAAKKAAEDLDQADPKTKVLIDAAQAAAADAVAKAGLCADDTVRNETLAQAKACIDAINAAIQAVTSAAMDEAKTQARGAANTACDTAKVSSKTSTDLHNTLTEAEKDLKQQQGLGTVSPALDPFLAAVTLAENNLAANPSNAGDLKALSDTAETAAQVHLTGTLLADPVILAAQTEAERLRKLADLPGATDADRFAAQNAQATAAKALATKAIAASLTVVTGIESPPASPQTIKTIPRSDGDALYGAAIGLKAAMSAALATREAQLQTLRTQIRIAEKATALKDKDGATPAETQAAIDANSLVTQLETELQAAQTAVDSVAVQAKALDKKVNKNVKVQIRHFEKLVSEGAPQLARDTQEGQMESTQQAAVICALIVKRNYSASFPPMSRDDLIATASTMNKADMSALSATDPVGAGSKAEGDTLHFCGRHTREYFGFEGRDFFEEEWLTNDAIARAASGDTNFNFPLNQMKTTSLWPVGFKESQIKDCMRLALTAVAGLTAVSNVGTIRQYLDTVGGNNRFQDVPITYNGEAYKVNIAISSKGLPSADPNTAIGQFVPTSTPSVPFFDMHAVKSAMKF